jgi:putative CRISPR-associated protein (TIGR02619 family)
MLVEPSYRCKAMRLAIASTVGTSLLRNFVADTRFRSIVDRFAMVDWDRVAVDDPRNTYPSGVICRALKNVELLAKLEQFALENPVRALAEVNGIETTLTKFPTPRGAVDVVLIASQTCNSLLCAQIARKVLKAMGYSNVEVVEVRALKSVDEFDEGLLELLDKVVEHIEGYLKRGYKVVVSATPGFKAETAFLTIVAMLLGIPSIYIHESFKAPVTLPVLPIRVDTATLSEVLELFRSSNCVNKGVAINVLGEKLSEHLFTQIITEKPGGEVCLRVWLSKLLKIVEQRIKE